MCGGVVLQRVGDLVVLVEGEEGRVEGRGGRGLQASLQLLGGAGARRGRLHVGHAAVGRRGGERTCGRTHTSVMLAIQTYLVTGRGQFILYGLK